MRIRERRFSLPGRKSTSGETFLLPVRYLAVVSEIFKPSVHGGVWFMALRRQVTGPRHGTGRRHRRDRHTNVRSRVARGPPMNAHSTGDSRLCVRLANRDVAQEVINAAEDRASALAASDAERLRELLHEQFRWTTHVGQTFDRTENIR